jgi:hypothetical protein
VIVGQPLDLSAFYALDNNMETWQKISNAMIDAISNLKRKLIDLEVNN